MKWNACRLLLSLRCTLLLKSILIFPSMFEWLWNKMKAGRSKFNPVKTEALRESEEYSFYTELKSSTEQKWFRIVSLKREILHYMLHSIQAVNLFLYLVTSLQFLKAEYFYLNTIFYNATFMHVCIHKIRWAGACSELSLLKLEVSPAFFFTKNSASTENNRLCV